MSFTTLIIIFGSCILLGILSIYLAKREIKKDIEYINTFVNCVLGLLDPKASTKTQNLRIDYILKNYIEASRIIGENVYIAPITELGANLSNNNQIDESLFFRIDAERKEFNGAKEREIININKQRLNPFKLLYRGVELVMNFVLGYFISRINSDFDHERNKIWRFLNCMITLFGSLASIYSCLHQILQ